MAQRGVLLPVQSSGECSNIPNFPKSSFPFPSFMSLFISLLTKTTCMHNEKSGLSSLLFYIMLAKGRSQVASSPYVLRIYWRVAC